MTKPASSKLLISVGVVLFAIAILYVYTLPIEPTETRSVANVSEVGPGVFVRHTQYQDANQTFVVFDEFVVVFDPGAARDAPELAAAIREKSDHPVRYVLSSHFHPDHASGASFFEKAGAEVLASATGKFDYEHWARDVFQRRVQEGIPGYEDQEYPTFTYIDEPFILDDGQQRLEIRHFGHGHTAGDLVGWLPKQELLLVSDLSNNGPLNLANADVGSWLNVLEQLMALPVRVAIPGHGELGGPELLAMNHRFLFQLLNDVEEMVKCGMRYEQVLGNVQIPFYEEWSGVAVSDNPTNIRQVFLEVGGKIPDESRVRRLWHRYIATGPTSCAALSNDP